MRPLQQGLQREIEPATTPAHAARPGDQPRAPRRRRAALARARARARAQRRQARVLRTWRGGRLVHNYVYSVGFTYKRHK